MAKIAIYMTGGIALYKGIEVIRSLERDGHQVRVAMTESATKLVTFNVTCTNAPSCNDDPMEL